MSSKKTFLTIFLLVGITQFTCNQYSESEVSTGDRIISEAQTNIVCGTVDGWTCFCCNTLGRRWGDTCALGSSATHQIVSCKSAASLGISIYRAGKK